MIHIDSEDEIEQEEQILSGPFPHEGEEQVLIPRIDRGVYLLHDGEVRVEVLSLWVRGEEEGHFWSTPIHHRNHEEECYQHWPRGWRVGEKGNHHEEEDQEKKHHSPLRSMGPS
jgi:hypothetical protein